MLFIDFFFYPVLVIFQQVNYSIWRQNQDDIIHFSMRVFLLISPQTVTRKLSKWTVWTWLIFQCRCISLSISFSNRGTEHRKMLCSLNHEQSKVVKDFIFGSANNPSEAVVHTQKSNLPLIGNCCSDVGLGKQGKKDQCQKCNVISRLMYLYDIRYTVTSFLDC